VLRIAEQDGIPVVHVPSTPVLQALVDASGHEARMAVLVQLESMVMDD
jgi:hypothetical protein